MTTINIRIDNSLKKKANKTLSDLGIDMSTAIKIFLNQVVVEEALPFTPSTKRMAIRNEWDKQVEEALKTKGFKNAKDALKI